MHVRCLSSVWIENRDSPPQVEPKRKARGGERRGLISYEVQGMQQPQQTPASRVPRLAESMLGHSIARVPELEASHRPEDGARVCEWEGEKLIVYRARDGQMHAIQARLPPNHLPHARMPMSRPANLSRVFFGEFLFCRADYGRFLSSV